MIWSKVKQQLEGFLCPELAGRVEYIISGYRYVPDKPAHCNMTVDRIEIFRMNDGSAIRWFSTEQEAKVEVSQHLTVDPDDVEKVRRESGQNIPEERLEIIARSHKAAAIAKAIFKAQCDLPKVDFQKVAALFLSESIEKSLESDDILLNVLALSDRRIGKKRLQAMADRMQTKHPAVRYFYALRRGL